MPAASAALLLGMAGRNHWSVSVRVPCRQIGGSGLTSPAAPGLPNRDAPAQCLSDAGPVAIVGRGRRARGTGWARLLPAYAWPLRKQSWPTIVRVEDDHLVVGPAQAGEAFTHRWRYDMVLVRGPASVVLTRRP